MALPHRVQGSEEKKHFVRIGGLYASSTLLKWIFKKRNSPENIGLSLGENAFYTTPRPQGFSLEYSRLFDYRNDSGLVGQYFLGGGFDWMGKTRARPAKGEKTSASINPFFVFTHLGLSTPFDKKLSLRGFLGLGLGKIRHSNSPYLRKEWAHVTNMALDESVAYGAQVGFGLQEFCFFADIIYRYMETPYTLGFDSGGRRYQEEGFISTGGVFFRFGFFF